MKRIFIIPVIVVLLVAIAVVGIGCGAKEGELPTLKVGNQWVYKNVENTTEWTLTLRVSGEEAVEGKDCYVINFSFEPAMEGMTEMKQWGDKETLLPIKMQCSGEDEEGQPPTWTTTLSHEFLEGSYWPLEVGKEFKQKVTITTTMDGEVLPPEITIGKVEKKEEIEVPAGKFNCFKIIERDEQGNMLRERWYSDKVKGDVKSIEYDKEGKVTMTSELGSYLV
jgi:hypothetical protein